MSHELTHVTWEISVIYYCLLYNVFAILLTTAMSMLFLLSWLMFLKRALGVLPSGSAFPASIRGVLRAPSALIAKGFS